MSESDAGAPKFECHNWGVTPHFVGRIANVRVPPLGACRVLNSRTAPVLGSHTSIALGSHACTHMSWACVRVSPSPTGLLPESRTTAAQAAAQCDVAVLYIHHVMMMRIWGCGSVGG
eukprot:7853544-Pyramimonas_sp.AAC.1